MCLWKTLGGRRSRLRVNLQALRPLTWTSRDPSPPCGPSLTRSLSEGSYLGPWGKHSDAPGPCLCPGQQTQEPNRLLSNSESHSLTPCSDTCPGQLHHRCPGGLRMALGGGQWAEELLRGSFPGCYKSPLFYCSLPFCIPVYRFFLTLFQWAKHSATQSAPN